jgi:hypothetical protein
MLFYLSFIICNSLGNEGQVFFHWLSQMLDTYIVVGPVLSEMHVSVGHIRESVNRFLLRTMLFVLIFNLVTTAREHDLPRDILGSHGRDY